MTLCQSRVRSVDVMCTRWSRDNVLIAFHSWKLATHFRAKMHHIFQLHVSQRCHATFMRLKRVVFDRMLALLHQARHYRALFLGRAKAYSRQMTSGSFRVWLGLVVAYRVRRRKMANLMITKRSMMMAMAFDDWRASLLRALECKQQERERIKLQVKVAKSFATNFQPFCARHVTL
jgi:hypothetical protein